MLCPALSNFFEFDKACKMNEYVNSEGVKPLVIPSKLTE